MVPSNNNKKPKPILFDQVLAFVEPLTINIDLAGYPSNYLLTRKNPENAGDPPFQQKLKKLTR